MSATRVRSKKVLVLAAASLVVLLAASLGIRLLARADQSSEREPAKLAAASHASSAPRVPLPAAPVAAPGAHVPDPAAFDFASLKVPCWGCPGSESWPVKFRTDLDLLAPLGTGPANAGVWLAAFGKPDGPRAAEADAAMKRRVEGPADLGNVLPANDPLLLEAEGWCDQATMRFYPDVYVVEGGRTRLPNLLVAITLARSWVARAESASDPARAFEDCRRAIRLGRLLRQDDAMVINDLVGLACIRVGAQGLYDTAQRQNDTRHALVAAIVLGEHAPQRLRTAQGLTTLRLSFVGGDAGPHKTISLSDAQLQEIVAVATGVADRRFRAEAIFSLGAVRHLGAAQQKAKASSFLDALAASDDPILSSQAAWCRDTSLRDEWTPAIRGD